jgi:hypothetical protein
MNTQTIDDYDSPWKEILEGCFPDFMAFYFPDAHAQIDWTLGYEFKNTELRQIVQEAEQGKGYIDALAQVTLKGHDHDRERWVCIHIEVQSQRDKDFAKRIYTYNYRLFDRYDRPIASMAILADSNKHWKPEHFAYEVLGCCHRLDFPTAKLLDYAEQIEALEHHANPFALVTLAHLATQQTKQDKEARYQAKIRLIRLLYQRDWSRERIKDLLDALDWMMRLPEGLEHKLWQEIQLIEGESTMRYIPSYAREEAKRSHQQGLQQGLQEGMQQGLQEGMQQGMQQGMHSLLERLIEKRFGPLSQETAARLKNASIEQLDIWAERILNAKSLSELFSNH